GGVALSDRSLIRIQAVSGLAFAVFLCLHLANTALATAGQGRYDAFQGAARGFYQFPAIEIALVVGAATVHACASIARILRRRGRRAAPIPLRPRLHRWSGYYLLLVLGGHCRATRGVGLFFGAPADFSFLNLSLSEWPWAFYPYYLLFAAAGLF